MSRNTIAVALSLALLTGIVVGQLTAGGSPTTVPGPGSSARRLELVRSFYEGMNAYLATGDEGFLHLLRSDFREGGSGSGEPGSITTLLDRLDAMRASSGVPHFTVHEMNDLGTVVQVRVSTTAPSTLDAAGFAIVSPMPDLGIDFLQVQGNAIASRWSNDVLFPRVDTATASRFDSQVGGIWRVEISHVSLQPGAQLPLESDLGTWMIVERGTISISTEAGIERLPAGEARPVLSVGQRLAMNYETSIASFWFARVYRSLTADAYTENVGQPEHHGATIQMLTTTVVGGLGPAATQLLGSFALARLSPGTQLEAVEDVQMQHLVVVHGTIDAAIRGGTFMHFDGSGRVITVRDDVSIGTGAALASIEGGPATFRIVGNESATVLLFTISN
jgi:hypothetical protein